MFNMMTAVVDLLQWVAIIILFMFCIANFTLTLKTVGISKRLMEETLKFMDTLMEDLKKIATKTPNKANRTK